MLETLRGPQKRKHHKDLYGPRLCGIGRIASIISASSVIDQKLSVTPAVIDGVIRTALCIFTKL
jgi:hypothetical protein